MVRVGLTGGIASGKTAVSGLLEDLGAIIIDADLLAREVVAPGTPGLAAVVARFGPQILSDGELDRSQLGRIVFADRAARRDLEQIVHPLVRARAAELEAAAPEDSVVVHVIPLLVETGQASQFDVCLVVDVEPEVQLQRLLDRGGLTPEEALARIEAQAGREQRLAVADLVIDNSGSRTDLEREVQEIWPQLCAPELSY